MKLCHTQLIIQAPIETVWNVLTDVKRYEEWNPTVTKVWGPFREGKLLYIHHIGLGLVVPIRLERFQPPHQLRWRTWGIFAPLVQGDHYFLLTDLGDGRTELQHGERLTGIMSHLLPALLLSKLQSNYAYHNQKIKVIAEQRLAAGAV